ncbi:hypothetical protein [Bauldia litoralis]|uniref:hypothetical protein n=1 Tax=Bauldia litoralis TaxID=665467 RepID=UPI003264B931
MYYATACEALRKGQRLNVVYDGYSRVVEVHAVGETKKGDEVMRVWQVRGGSVSNEPEGWKLLRLDEATSFGVLDERSLAPRNDYRRDDRVMARIYCQL